MGFRLARPVEQPPPIFLAALRPGMLRLAGRAADGVIINWLSADDVAKVIPELGADIPVAARIFVIPSEDADMCPGHRPPDDHRLPQRRRLRRIPPVAGAGEVLGPMWRLWQDGDRKGALAAIPDEVVDDLVVHGSFAECRDRIGRYVANGVDIPALAVLPFGVDLAEAVEGLSPR